MRDLATKIKGVELTMGTTVVDRAGFESVTLLTTVEDGTVIGVVEGDESDLSDGAAVSADFLIGKTTFATADGDIGRVGYVGGKRYVKFSYTASAPTTYNGIAVLGDAHNKAVDQYS